MRGSWRTLSGFAAWSLHSERCKGQARFAALSLDTAQTSRFLGLTCPEWVLLSPEGKEPLQMAVRVHLRMEHADNADERGGRHVVNDVLAYPELPVAVSHIVPIFA